MTEPDLLRVLLNIEPAADGDAEEGDELARRLRAELSGLNLDLLTTLSASELSPAVQEPPRRTSRLLEYGLLPGALTMLVAVVRSWLRSGNADRRIQVTIGGDTIELKGATPAEQQLLIDEFLRRHTAG